jgi:predicted dehydrogenase
VLGAGPGVAALHLPTIARVAGRFHVVHIADGGSGRARALAGPRSARWSTGEDELLADPDVEVVAICTPPAEHARQILAAVDAGARAIFCEKPLATTIEDAEQVVEACRAAGVVLMVGTNHLFDAAWGRAKHHLVHQGERVQTVSVTLALPPNGRYHELVAEGGPFMVVRGGAPDLEDPRVAASMVRSLISGLAVHDLPALRDLAPDVERVVFARAIAPVGFAVGYIASGIGVTITALLQPDGPDALWRLSIGGAHDRVDVDFPPAFVHAGSAAVTVRHGGGRVTRYRRDAEDGYEAEWRAFAALVEGSEAVEYDEILADARYALRIADEAAALIREAAA